MVESNDLETSGEIRSDATFFCEAINGRNGLAAVVESAEDVPMLCFVVNGDKLDQQQPTVSGFFWGVYGDGVKLAQSFKPTLDVLTRVELNMFRLGSPEGITISIREELTQEDLTSIYVPADEILNTSRWFEFDFPDIGIIKEHTYYIVWFPEGATDRNNTFYWGLMDKNPYVRGSSWENLNGTWEEIRVIEFGEKRIEDPDFCFKTYGFSNSPPNKPTTPSGPTKGNVVGENLYYESYFCDPDGDAMQILFDWGDGTNTGWIKADTNGTFGSYHSWSSNGSYEVKAKAKDLFFEGEWSDPLIVTIGNCPPDKPLKPVGPQTGKPGKLYSYSTSTSDPDLDEIFYKFDWGDGTDSGWLGPFSSGATINASHYWTKSGNYSVRVIAMDELLQLSEWSDPLPVSIPKNKAIEGIHREAFRFFTLVRGDTRGAAFFPFSR
jgi:hypothetical protein